MKIAKFEQIITPEVGTTIGGYGPFDETYRKVGELVVSLLAMDDGKNKALILGYDLIGMDEPLIDRVRRDAAQALAVQTVLGSALMVAKSGTHPAILKDAVTSPGGTTIRALEVLADRNFSGTVIQAVRAAAKRSRELGAGK